MDHETPQEAKSAKRERTPPRRRYPWKAFLLQVALPLLVVAGLTGHLPGIPIDISGTFGSPVWLIVSLAAVLVGAVVTRVALSRR